MKIIDINRENVTTPFRFKNSLHKFIIAEDTRTGETSYVDLTENLIYDFDQIVDMYEFYTFEEDEDFFGVMAE